MKVMLHCFYHLGFYENKNASKFNQKGFWVSVNHLRQWGGGGEGGRHSKVFSTNWKDSYLDPISGGWKLLGLEILVIFQKWRKR